MRLKYEDDPSKYIYVPKYDYVQDLVPEKVLSDPELSCTHPNCSLLPSEGAAETEEKKPESEESEPKKEEKSDTAASKGDPVTGTGGPDCIYCKMMKDLKTGDECVLKQFGDIENMFSA